MRESVVYGVQQCFSNGVPRNRRILREAARAPPKQTEIFWGKIHKHISIRL